MKRSHPQVNAVQTVGLVLILSPQTAPETAVGRGGAISRSRHPPPHDPRGPGVRGCHRARRSPPSSLEGVPPHMEGLPCSD